MHLQALGMQDQWGVRMFCSAAFGLEIGNGGNGKMFTDLPGYMYNFRRELWLAILTLRKEVAQFCAMNQPGFSGLKCSQHSWQFAASRPTLLLSTTALILDSVNISFILQFTNGSILTKSSRNKLPC